MEDALLTIGEVARRVGIATSAIRYYERNGVLPEPARVSGQRRYTEATVDRLRILDVAKRAGFTLAEAKVLLATMDGGSPAHEQLQELARRKLPEVQALIARAEAMRDWLTTATACGCDTLDVCALFETPSDAPAAPLRLVQVGGGH
jgi:MerR family transcriptional regulator, redox-sensitive transcriptional activator SoxR